MGSLDWKAITAISNRTLRQAVESPIIYVVAVFFFGFVGSLFSMFYFRNGQASIDGVRMTAPWVLWFVIPALTMGLFSEELRSGTFEQLATLPLRDWEIVLGKYIGFALLALKLIGGLLFFAVIAGFTAKPIPGLDWGSVFGSMAGLYMECLLFGAMGLFASSLAKNQVVALIVGMIFCTGAFFIGQFTSNLPSLLAPLAEFLGTTSHVESLGRGVWDFRDIAYFASGIGFFLFLTVQRLTLRRV